MWIGNIHARIHFTMEEEEGGSLPFMDVRFTCREDGTLIRQIYQKPTHTNRYIQFDSHHPASVKSGVIQGLTDCAMKVCSGIVERNQELRRIENVMVEKGYPRKFTQKTISRQLKRERCGECKESGLQGQRNNIWGTWGISPKSTNSSDFVCWWS